VTNPHNLNIFSTVTVSRKIRFHGVGVSEGLPVGWMAARSAYWLDGWLDSWLAGSLAGRLTEELVDWLDNSLVVCLVC
jgi:hypothetical protein